MPVEDSDPEGLDPVVGPSKPRRLHSTAHQATGTMALMVTYASSLLGVPFLQPRCPCRSRARRAEPLSLIASAARRSRKSQPEQSSATSRLRTLVQTL
jgi:hypothetical protein